MRKEDGLSQLRAERRVACEFVVVDETNRHKELDRIQEEWYREESLKKEEVARRKVSETRPLKTSLQLRRTFDEQLSELSDNLLAEDGCVISMRTSDVDWGRGKGTYRRLLAQLQQRSKLDSQSLLCSLTLEVRELSFLVHDFRVELREGIGSAREPNRRAKREAEEKRR